MPIFEYICQGCDYQFEALVYGDAMAAAGQLWRVFLALVAMLLLAVDALRRKDTTKAREILSDLSRQFPHNRLYTEELARLR